MSEIPATDDTREQGASVIVNEDYMAEDGGVEPEDISMTEPFDPLEIDIASQPDAMSNIIRRLGNDEIDMGTDFQRNPDLWDPTKMSKLIESILIRFPLPAFYFDATNDDKWLVVDGLQRLSSIKKFVVLKKLKLRGLEYLTKLEGKSYDELSRTYKRRIDECPITLFLIRPGTPPAVKYSIFRRINTGGLVLRDQEIRNAMASPETREMMKSLAENSYLKKTIGDKSKRMADQELILRFLAFLYLGYENTKKTITGFLDEMMKHIDEASTSDREGYVSTFNCAIQGCWDIFQDRAFEKSSTGSLSKRKSPKSSTLFEVWMCALANTTKHEMAVLCQKRDLVVKKHLEAMGDDTEEGPSKYFLAISFSTRTKDNYTLRHNRAREIIREVLDA